MYGISLMFVFFNNELLNKVHLLIVKSKNKNSFPYITYSIYMYLTLSSSAGALPL